MESLGYLLISGVSRPSQLTGIQACLWICITSQKANKLMNIHTRSIAWGCVCIIHIFAVALYDGKINTHFLGEINVNFCEASLGKLYFGKFTLLPYLVEKLKSDMRHGWKCDMKCFESVCNCAAKKIWVVISFISFPVISVKWVDALLKIEDNKLSHSRIVL